MTKRVSRETWLVLGLVAVLVITTVIAAIWQTNKVAPPPLSSASNERDGARALRLWLDQLGYQVTSQAGQDYLPPADADLIFMLEPFTDTDTNHWKRLDEWINAGGTLVAAGVDWGADGLFQHFKFTTYSLEGPGEPTVQSPLMASPPLDHLGYLEMTWAFSTDRDDFSVLLAEGSKPALIIFRQGAGRVILASFIYPLSNIGLNESGNAELVLNLLALAGKGRRVWFDEWHHGVGQPGKIVGPQDWLRFSPAGHALLFIAAILFLALILQGRGFGLPIPLSRPTARRASLEYITALANLSRRAGHRIEVLQHYRHSLKSQLARRYRINPAMPDEEYVMQLARYQPGLDADELIRLLKRLRSSHVSEGEMVRLAAETAEWLKDNL